MYGAIHNAVAKTPQGGTHSSLLALSSSSLSSGTPEAASLSSAVASFSFIGRVTRPRSANPLFQRLLLGQLPPRLLVSLRHAPPFSHKVLLRRLLELLSFPLTLAGKTHGEPLFSGRILLGLCGVRFHARVHGVERFPAGEGDCEGSAGGAFGKGCRLISGVRNARPKRSRW